MGSTIMPPDTLAEPWQNQLYQVHNKKRKLRPTGHKKPPAILSRMNTVVCGDTVKELDKIDGCDLFDVVIADPPYNINKDFGNNRDSMLLSDYITWSQQWIQDCLRLVKPNCFSAKYV